MPSRKSFLTVPLLIELTHVLAPPGPLLPLLVVLTHVLAPPGPLLPLLVVMTHVLALPGPLLPLIFAHCQLIAPNSSLQDLHAFVLEQQPSFDSLFLWGNEDSLFNSLLWYIITALLPFLVGKMRIHYLIV